MGFLKKNNKKMIHKKLKETIIAFTFANHRQRLINDHCSRRRYQKTMIIFPSKKAFTFNTLVGKASVCFGFLLKTYSLLFEFFNSLNLFLNLFGKVLKLEASQSDSSV